MADEAIEAEVTDAAPEAVQAQEDAPATQEAAKSETLLDAPEKETEAPSRGEWPEDWRDRLANGDEALRKRLDRFSSPANVIKSWREAEKKLASGEVKKPLAADAKPEEVAAWRKENGLPETVEDMLKAVEPPKGMVFGEADKPVLESFAKVAHERNWSPAQMNDAVAWYAAEQERILAQRTEQDRAYQAQAQDDLREEWGAAYRSEINSVKNFLDSNVPAEVKDAILSGRGPDGNLLGNNPHVLKWLAEIARKENPFGTIMPNGSEQAATNRIAEIEQIMATDIDQYFRNPSMEAEYRRLIEARDRKNARAA